MRRSSWPHVGVVVPVIAAVLLAGCSANPSSGTGGTGSTRPYTSSTAAAPASVARRPLRYSHVWVVVMENLGYSGALATPGLATLARRYAYVTDSYAAGHPSLPNYLALTAGSTLGVTSDCLTCYTNAPNLGEQLSAKHVSWDAYLQSVSQPCYLGTSYGEYAAKHNPFRYFADIRSSRALCSHLRPYSELPGVLRGPAGKVPRFVWVTPDICNDGHDCSSAVASRWLGSFVRLVTASAAWRDHGLLVVTWDEGSFGDSSVVTPSGAIESSGGGGHILTILVGRGLHGSYAIPLTHEGVLAAIEQNFGLPYLAGARQWAGHTLLDVIGRRRDPPSTASSTTTDWTTYHRYATGSGRGPSALDLAHLAPAWTSKTLDGDLYGEPLVFGKEVYVATENDTVYALSAAHGTVVWSRHLARPFPSSRMPCGNITPRVGITSTPVIDPSRHEIFVVADEDVNGSAHHEIYGLSTTNGRIEMRQRADPPGANPRYLLNRASLVMDNSRVVFGFGGNYGDCEPYHGWVESVPVTGGTARFFEVDHGRGQSQGAIWMGGAAPIVERSGDIWVAAGNGSVGTGGGSYDGSDSVLELSPSMKLLQYFAPSTWRRDNSSDADLGSAAPAVLGNGLVVQAGKSQTAFLLRQSHLGGIGGQIDDVANVCATTLDGGVAFAGSTVYLPCEAGVIAVGTNATSGKMRLLWRTPTGAGGPPILAGGYVWTISGGFLDALDPANGREVQRLSLGVAADDFPTPSVGDGLLIATSSNRVHAFRHAV